MALFLWKCRGKKGNLFGFVRNSVERTEAIVKVVKMGRPPEVRYPSVPVTCLPPPRFPLGDPVQFGREINSLLDSKSYKNLIKSTLITIIIN